MNTLKDFSKIVDAHMIAVILLSLLMTFVCSRLNFQADLPSSFVGIAIVFPVVFSINAAYKRREDALGYFADLKANIMSLFYAFRDWVPEKDGKTELKNKFKQAASETFNQLHLYLKNTRSESHESLSEIYRQFSILSKLHEDMRAAGVPANEISRANQYVKAIIADFEKMRNICLYRTPVALRAYSKLFLTVFPIVFGPYFASIAMKYYPAVGYMLSFLYSIVLVSLNHIQEDLENPFDGVGEDDIRLDVRMQYEKIMSEE